LVIVEPDVVMVHDSIAPSVIRILREQLGGARVRHPERVAAVIDHVSPASTVATAGAQRDLRAWVKDQGITNFFDMGRGIAHQVLIEQRLAIPGRVIIGTDSHSTAYGAVAAFGTGMGATDVAVALATGRTWLRVPETIRVEVSGRFRPGVGPKDLALAIVRTLGADGATYKALEYHGCEKFSVGARTTLSTMALEAGAKAGIVAPAGLPAAWPTPSWLTSQVPAGGSGVSRIAMDLGRLTPQVAAPDTVDNVVDLPELGRVPVDVVYLGTCTNGRHEDMAAAARILKGRRLAAGVRMMVVPASSEALKLAVSDGTLAALLDAGATVGPPGCGACIGRHMGVLADGETCLFTGNRNFRGRMGSPNAKIYLGSPEVAAATAVLGWIADPAELSTLVAAEEGLS
jgi:methanogen homoaconitase large subunit